MSSTWYSDEPPDPHQRITLAGWMRVVLRGLPMGTIVFSCLGLLLLVRLIERPLFGVRRPWTPWITRFVCNSAIAILGMKLVCHGVPMQQRGAGIANHSSWLDIFTLNARQNIYFVSKSEVAGWPGIGWLARATGTLFIRRDRREAAKQTMLLRDRLLAGHHLLFFPEGTSTDGRDVLPFKTTLFAPFF
ncbi:MAG: lysophospholipid acyltransferase family protein, partial [Pseudomonadota bacterium]